MDGKYKYEGHNMVINIGDPVNLGSDYNNQSNRIWGRVIEFIVGAEIYGSPVIVCVDRCDSDGNSINDPCYSHISHLRPGWICKFVDTFKGGKVSYFDIQRYDRTEEEYKSSIENIQVKKDLKINMEELGLDGLL